MKDVILTLQHIINSKNNLKYLNLLLLLLLTHSGFSQNGMLPLDEKKNATYTDKASPQKPKAELYKAAQSWVGKVFGNYENAVTKQDPETGLLVINTYIPAKTKLYDYIRFDLTIVCTDNHYEAHITRLDGTAQHRSPTRLGINENNLVTEKEMAVKTENNRKKRAEAEENLENARIDNEIINAAMYNVLGSLKEHMSQKLQ